MGQTMRFQETLRRLTMIEQGFAEDAARLGLGPVKASTLDSKTAALLQAGARGAIGSSAVCLEWGTGRALAAGARADEIVGVLLAIAPVTGLGRVVSAAPGIATAPEDDIAAAPGKQGLLGCRPVTSARWPPRRRHHGNHLSA